MTCLKPNITSQVEGGDKETLRHEKIYITNSHSMGVSRITSFSWVTPSLVAHWLFPFSWLSFDLKCRILYRVIFSKLKFTMVMMKVCLVVLRNTLLWWTGIKSWPNFVQRPTNSMMWFQNGRLGLGVWVPFMCRLARVWGGSILIKSLFFFWNRVNLIEFSSFAVSTCSF